MYLTKQQISILFSKLGEKLAPRIIKNFHNSYCKYLSSSDVEVLYDDIYRAMLKQHPIHKIINNTYKINIYNKYIYEYLIKRINNNTTILDIGCGDGDVLLALAQKNIKYGLGIDFSINAINDCKNKLKLSGLNNCQFICEDASSINNINKTFDYVILNDITEHISDKELSKLFINLKKFINTKSEILIHTPNGMALCNNTDIDLFQRIRILLKKLQGWKGYHWTVDELYYLQVHINVKSYRQLKSFLKKLGFKSKVIYDEPFLYFKPFSYLFSSNILIIAKLINNK